MSKKTKAELEAYIEAQNEIIIELNEKVKKLEAQNTPSSEIIPTANEEDVDREICRMQLDKLYQKAHGRELSMEETKKAEIFTKLLISLDQKPKKSKNPATDLSDEDLLAEVYEIDSK